MLQHHSQTVNDDISTGIKQRPKNATLKNNNITNIYGEHAILSEI